ncbi:GDSL-type esterase/lipase family protein [Conexibacter sp. DBS9H8]|uniref:SGNH/GDSL hydrolase family protein n=1 Tax=Conexibacter sp. DBS9H8 TaxID=2937801 RepID=UPI00201000CE|nr:GDSL-type esterase/lipase family protein [Conexibacter sp. DBS9H8]
MGAGVLALGDSITNAGGEIQQGVALQSWALWTARGLGLPYTPYAVDGATVQDVLAVQLPRFEAAHADPDARFELGCLYIGTNDIRRPDWDQAAFEAAFSTALEWLARRCARTLTATIPARMGRPPHPRRIAQVNAAITRVAAAHGALVLDLTDFGARNLMMADHIHPTAFGQVAIAERALTLLAGDGLVCRVHPSTLIAPARTWLGRLQDDLATLRRGVRFSLLERAARRRMRSGPGAGE